jgi:hypothetical protein
MTGLVRAGMLLLVGVASRAFAQDTTALITGDREASAELADIIQAAKSDGLPIDPILAKVRYAVFVAHASPARTVAAARATMARLEEARKALAPHPTERDIIAGQDALSASVSSKALQAVRKVSPNRPVAVPLAVLAQLVGNHISEDSASRIVTDLIRRGASTKQIADLGNDVNQDVALGTRASSALELRMNRLNAVLGIPTSNGDAVTATSPTSLDGPGKKKP